MLSGNKNEWLPRRAVRRTDEEIKAEMSFLRLVFRPAWDRSQYVVLNLKYRQSKYHDISRSIWKISSNERHCFQKSHLSHLYLQKTVWDRSQIDRSMRYLIYNNGSQSATKLRGQFGKYSLKSDNVFKNHIYAIDICRKQHEIDRCMRY